MAISSSPLNHTAAGGAGRLRPGAMLYVACVVVLAALGGLLGMQMLRASGTDAHEHVHAAGPVGFAVPARTSFGALQVQDVHKITGLTPKSVGGVTHFPSYLPPNKMQVQISLELSNTVDKAAAYSPGQFRLRVGRGAAIVPSGATVEPGTLQPGTAVDATISFTAARTTKSKPRLVLEFYDRGREQPVRVDLGSARTAGSIPKPTPGFGHLYHSH